MYKINITLQIACKNSFGIPNKNKFQCWIQPIALLLAINSNITIRIVDIPESKYLNFKYRGKNSPTNILSFIFNQPDNLRLSNLGDLILCKQIIEQEAVEQKKIFYAHWAHIVIHGCLHLIGYDHSTIYETKIMTTIEKKIMHYLGFPNPY
uniref:Endoribonuclease YbeY n=1 Tax=Candidatus Aschnera chinzeii TaxID=1485666 RepID=A0AAT9G4P5_9ENTR|nr:MAG: rRNA maturation RNase YbeY [Candidatus Aschnera chinzeii]